jgi:hypothetical protein
VRPEQLNIYKKMSPEQKLRLSLDLYHSARLIKRAGLKHQHPDWSDTQIEKKLKEIFLYATN